MRKYQTKLSEQQKEYITILGRYVKSADLGNEFNVSQSTISNLKREKGMKTFNRKYKKRLNTAIDTYLTTSDQYIKDKTIELVFLPIAKEVAKSIGEEVILRPRDEYLRLYKALFGYKFDGYVYREIPEEKIEIKKKIKGEEIINKIINKLIIIDYVLNKQFNNKSNLIDHLKDDIIKDLSVEQYKPIPSELKAEFDDSLSTLTEREEKVLKYRFGIKDGHPRTLEEIGSIFNVGKERIRQIEAKALRKLHHPTRSRKLRDTKEVYLNYLTHLKGLPEEHLKKESLETKLCQLTSQIDKIEISPELKELLKSVIENSRHQLIKYRLADDVESSLNFAFQIKLAEYIDSKLIELKGYTHEDWIKLFEQNKKIELTKQLSTPIRSLELSVRSSNCLKEANIQIIRDLVQKSEKELLSRRNFGKKSLAEIKGILTKMGLSLAMTVSESTK